MDFSDFFWVCTRIFVSEQLLDKKFDERMTFHELDTQGRVACAESDQQRFTCKLKAERPPKSVWISNAPRSERRGNLASRWSDPRQVHNEATDAATANFSIRFLWSLHWPLLTQSTSPRSGLNRILAHWNESRDGRSANENSWRWNDEIPRARGRFVQSVRRQWTNE